MRKVQTKHLDFFVGLYYNAIMDIKEYIPFVIKIVEWAQRRKIKVQNLTKKDLQEARKSKH
jgi:hypothetical protein